MQILSELLSQSGWMIIDAAVKGLAISLLAVVVAAILRKRAAAWKHLMWSVTTVGLLLLPLLSALLPAWQIPVPGEWTWNARSGETAPRPNVESNGNADEDIPVSASLDYPAGTAVGVSTENETEKRSRDDRADGSTATRLPPAARVDPQSSEIATHGHVATAAANARHSAGPHGLLWTGSLLLALPAVWLAGACLALLIPLTGLWQLHRMRGNSTPVSEEQWQSLLLSLTTTFGIRRPVSLESSAQTQTPLTWGAARPVILLPSGAEAWSDPRRRLVLIHELAHIKRLDWLTQMIGQFACSLHWFNPLAWYAVRRMQIERELACDDLVIAGGTRASDYASELLDCASQLHSKPASVLSAVPMARRSSLEQRVRSILDTSRRRQLLTRATLIAGISIGCCLTIPLAMLQALAKGSKQPEATSTDDGAPEPNPESTNGESTAKAVLLAGRSKHKLPNGRSIEITQQVFHGADVMTNAVFRWPAKGPRPALRHEVNIAADAFGNRDHWVAVWERGTTRVWIASTGIGRGTPYLRLVDFHDPRGAVTWTRFDTSKPAGPDKSVAQARRRGIAIPDPPESIPTAVVNQLGKALPKIRDLTKGRRQFSGPHIEPAKTDAEWTIRGTVRDRSSQPLKGVHVEASAEDDPRKRVVSNRTDGDGRYQLRYRIDVETLSRFRGFRVAPKLPGYFEREFARSGEFTLKLRADEDLQNAFSTRTCVLGNSSTADFILHPAVSVRGQVVDENGRPRAKAFVGIRHPQQRRGFWLTWTQADEQGRFRLGSVPPDQPLRLRASVFESPQHSDEVDGFVARLKEPKRLRLQLGRKSDEAWALKVFERDLPAGDPRDGQVRIRLVELQNEIDPPERPAAFADKVITLAESCRENRSTLIVSKKPRVWSQVISWHSLVHLVFDPPRQARLIREGDAGLDVNGRPKETFNAQVSEIAFALYETGATGMFLKADGKVLCLDNWTYDALMPVISEPALNVRRMKWYRRLLDSTALAKEPPVENTATVVVATDGSLSFGGKAVDVQNLIRVLSDAGFKRKTATVLLQASRDVKLTGLHWPLWKLDTSYWKNVRLEVSKNRIDLEDGVPVITVPVGSDSR